jgi:uracil-DNA glycosylase
LSECLYRANIDPFASLSEITKEQRRRLFQEAQSVAIESYRSQGLTRKGGSFRNVEGEKGKFEFELQCYGRETCAKGKPVLTEKEGPHGRAIWYVEDQLTMPLTQRIQGGVGASLPVPPSPEEGVLSFRYENSGWYTRIDLQDALKDPGWKKVLSSAMQTDSFRNLQAFLAEEEASGAIIYPRADDVFRALNLCPFDKVKVVICGQDPYHGSGQADGLAFSVQQGVNLPPSLKNIFCELVDDMLLPQPMHGNLDRWANEGVLLLNTVLTVRQGEANSHKGRGWEEFTDAVIQGLNDQKDDGIVFLLWGNPAAKKAARVDSIKHSIIRTSHPSPLGATKTDSPFLSSRCFSKANDALAKMGQDPIDWTLNYWSNIPSKVEQKRK